MNDELTFEYLLNMAAMQPQQEDQRRKQAMVDALRGQAMQPLQGQMVGKHYVAPGIGQALAQMGTAYIAGQQQKSADQSMQKMTGDQRLLLQDMLRRRRNRQGPGAMTGYDNPYSNLPTYGNEA
jgi:hypothetical protein